jgi:hypothetical protein
VVEVAPTCSLPPRLRGQIAGVILGTTDGLWGYPKRLIVRPSHRRQRVARLDPGAGASVRGPGDTSAQRDDPAWQRGQHGAVIFARL